MKYILLLFITPVLIFSETIILKNGSTVQGKVLGHDSDSVTISVDGVSKQIPKNQVHKVVFTSNNIELNKIVKDKRKQEEVKQKQKSVEPKIQIDDDNEEDDDENKKDIYQKLIILKQNQEKYEKKIARIRMKINKLKQKLKNKKETS